MGYFFGGLLIFVLLYQLFIRQIKFGKIAKGERLKALKKSPNYGKNHFENTEFTPALSEGVSYWSIILKLLKKHPNKVPSSPIPYLKTDLKSLDIQQNCLIWFGHSSYLLQVDGIRILVDPVLNGTASPIAAMMKPFKGSQEYSTMDLPKIDYLFITHDHWDHLDYDTVKIFDKNNTHVICGLGVGEHFKYWGFKKDNIVEKDWWESHVFAEKLKVTFVPTRHFSGRRFKRNTSLWGAFVLELASKRILIGGDSGYGKHFKEIGDRFGEFDLAILENGQYDANWKYIHMTPETVLKAAKDLQTKMLFPVHSGKFALANHPWNEPLERISDLHDTSENRLITPMIGEVVDIDDANQQFSKWWTTIK